MNSFDSILNDIHLSAGLVNDRHPRFAIDRETYRFRHVFYVNVS